MGDLEIKLKNIIIKNSRRKICENEITDSSNLITDFGFDSVLMIELIIELEKEFDITILDDEDFEIDIITKYIPLKELILRKTMLAMRVKYDC
jgi:acyl carrier protein